MQVGAIGGAKNSFFVSARQGQNTTQNSERVTRKGRRDSAAISPAGKAVSRIETLNKQKETIAQSRERLITRTLEKGGKLESIELQLDTFEEQLKNIDEQIARIAAEQISQLVKKEEKAKAEKPKTEEELQAKQLNLVAESHNGVKQAQIVSSAKEKVDGDASVLKSEIELDKGHGTDKIKKILLPGTRKSVSLKSARLDELEARSAQLSAQFGKELAESKEAAEEAKEPAEPKPTEQEEEAEQATNENLQDEI